MHPLASIVDTNDDEVLQIPMGTVNILINDNQNDNQNFAQICISAISVEGIVPNGDNRRNVYICLIFANTYNFMTVLALLWYFSELGYLISLVSILTGYYSIISYNIFALFTYYSLNLIELFARLLIMFALFTSGGAGFIFQLFTMFGIMCNLSIAGLLLILIRAARLPRGE